MMTLIELFEIS